MEVLREEIQAVSHQNAPASESQLQEGTKSTFQGLIVGLALGTVLWCGAILIWLAL